MEDNVSLLREIANTAKIQFTNWVMPSKSTLEREYQIEYELKNLGRRLGDPFPTNEDFIKACREGEIIVVDSSMDDEIDYRSRTTSKAELLSLIKTYRSYPEFRNEQTLDQIYEGFKNNKPMEMPIIISQDGGRYIRIFSGNTRMDVAFQLGINPKAILLEI